MVQEICKPANDNCLPLAGEAVFSTVLLHSKTKVSLDREKEQAKLGRSSVVERAMAGQIRPGSPLADSHESSGGR